MSRAVPRSTPGLALVALLVLAPIAVACSDDARPTTSTYRVVIEPCQGRTTNRATAAAVAPDLLVTVAHSFADVGTVQLHRGDENEAVAARLVYFDPVKDIAVLRAERPLGDHLDLIEPDGPGPVGVVRYGAADQAGIERAELVELVDVTLDGEGRRAGARLAATIEPGDSGAPVLDADGRMVAMVFAAGRSGDTGWAVSSREVDAALAALDVGRPGTEPPACRAG